MECSELEHQQLLESCLSKSQPRYGPGAVVLVYNPGTGEAETED